MYPHPLCQGSLQSFSTTFDRKSTEQEGGSGACELFRRCQRSHGVSAIYNILGKQESYMLRPGNNGHARDVDSKKNEGGNYLNYIW